MNVNTISAVSAPDVSRFVSPLGQGLTHIADVLARTLDRRADAELACGRTAQAERLAFLAAELRESCR